mgnify:CR=1 FL=1
MGEGISTIRTSSRSREPKVTFGSASGDTILKEIKGNQDGLKRYLGGSSEITSVNYKDKISTKDRNGNRFDGAVVEIRYTTDDPYRPGRRRNESPLTVAIDSNGFVRERTTSYPSSGARQKVEYGLPRQQVAPSFKNKFK